MKKINKIFLTLFAVLFTTLPLIGFSNNANAALSNPTCAAGDGCRITCLAETGVEDLDCLPGCEVYDSAGLIPCGRSCDDPDTTWEEDKPCDLCSLVLMGQLIIELLLKLAAVFAILAIAFGGFVYMFAVGNSGTIDKAKSIIKYTLIGFLIVFIAWAIVNTLLTMFGYIDPVGGAWHSVDC